MGQHKTPRRKLGQPAEAFAEQDKLAAEAGLPWSEWAAGVLQSAAKPPRRDEKEVASTDKA